MPVHGNHVLGNHDIKSQDSKLCADPTQLIAKTPHLSIFLRNLRLLNLDRQRDWPSIDQQTFRSKQDQKHRVNCAEWVLFRLFELWDLEDAKNRLQPFFPPLEPLQSLNLRAALFRLLSELKKDGTLGRDAVIRKNTLDDCKGDKFEEILAVFSTAVLRKTASGDVGLAVGNISARIALAESLRASDAAKLGPLVVAHRVSLTNNLRHRGEQRFRLDDTLGLLDLKERQIVRRREQFKATRESYIHGSASHGEAQSLHRQFRDNWTGDSQWLDELLDAGDYSHCDGILSRTAEEVWEHVNSGNVPDLEEQGSSGLLESLAERVRQQQTRLDNWTRFRKQIKSQQNPPENCSKGLPLSPSGAESPWTLDFSAHREINLSVRENKDLSAWALPTESSNEQYLQLVDSMKMDLRSIGRAKNEGPSKHNWRRILPKPTATILDRENAPTTGQCSSNETSHSSRDTPSIDTETEDGKGSPDVTHGFDPALNDSDRTLSHKDNVPCGSDLDLGVKLEPPVNDSSGIPNERHIDRNSDSDVLVGRDFKRAAQPRPKRSPRKTRMSLLDLDDPDYLAEKITAAITTFSPERDEECHPFEQHSSLAERTPDHTTAAVPQMISSPMQSIAHEQSLSRSPATPAQPSTPTYTTRFDSRHSTPREELFSQEADYASVFRSRPKVKASPPTGSPERKGHGIQEESPLARMSGSRANY